VKLFREEIDDFAFTFVAPLRAEDYEIGHETRYQDLLPSFLRLRTAGSPSFRL
jgi:hypothetical protein